MQHAHRTAFIKSQGMHRRGRNRMLLAAPKERVRVKSAHNASAGRGAYPKTDLIASCLAQVNVFLHAPSSYDLTLAAHILAFIKHIGAGPNGFGAYRFEHRCMASADRAGAEPLG